MLSVLCTASTFSHLLKFSERLRLQTCKAQPFVLYFKQ